MIYADIRLSAVSEQDHLTAEVQAHHEPAGTGTISLVRVWHRKTLDTITEWRLND